MKKIKQFFDTNFNRVNLKWIYNSFGFFIIFILPWILQYFVWAGISFGFLILASLFTLAEFYEKQRKKVDDKEQQSKLIIFTIHTIEIIKEIITRIFEASTALVGLLFGVIFWILIIGGLIGILIFGWKQIL